MKRFSHSWLIASKKPEMSISSTTLTFRDISPTHSASSALKRFIQHRIGDNRVLRHLEKWLKAGILEDGKWRPSKRGTPQGGSVSPLLANVYLHYVFDLWADQWRRRYGHGDIIIVRYADDVVVGFEKRRDAEGDAHSFHGSMCSRHHFFSTL